MSFLSHSQLNIVAFTDQAQVATPDTVGGKKDEQLKKPTSKKTTKKASQKAERSDKQPRIFHAPNHITITDDASTQGTPSPHSTAAFRPELPTPVTPISNKTQAVETIIENGKKRKADEKHDARPARRARVAHGTPWSLRYN